MGMYHGGMSESTFLFSLSRPMGRWMSCRSQTATPIGDRSLNVRFTGFNKPSYQHSILPRLVVRDISISESSPAPSPDRILFVGHSFPHFQHRRVRFREFFTYQ